MWLFRFIVVGVIVAGMLSGCSRPKNMFVLLPEEDGSVGRVSVTNSYGVQVLDQAWQVTGMDSVEEAPLAPRTLSPGQVEALFGDVLSTDLQRPVLFILYFKKDSTELTEASVAQIPVVIDTIHARQSVDTSVVGHSDTVGSNRYNVLLSQKRAVIVAQRLGAEGIDSEILDVSSHGERNPLIATADEIFEPRNRRVEITVR